MQVENRIIAVNILTCRTRDTFVRLINLEHAVCKVKNYVI